MKGINNPYFKLEEKATRSIKKNKDKKNKILSTLHKGDKFAMSIG